MPTKRTLDRYGLTLASYKKMLAKCGGRCPICGRRDVELVIDHEHVRGWKRMAASERRKYVRGLVCRHDNHRILGRYAKPQLLLNAANYLLEYERNKA